MTLPPGNRPRSHELLASPAAGGTREVSRAKDIRLSREAS